MIENAIALESSLFRYFKLKGISAVFGPYSENQRSSSKQRWRLSEGQRRLASS